MALDVTSPDPRALGKTFSVVIPAFNEERCIRQCLQSIRDQRYPQELIDIIVVDNGSTDQTVAFCIEAGALVLSHPRIRVGAMRNRGANAAAGEVLAFLDADCLADPDWLTNAASALSEEWCVTGGPHELPRHPHWIERAWYSQEHRTRRSAQLIPSGNMIVPREVFLRLGGFNEDLIAGEDAEFSLRASKVVPVIADHRIRAIHLGNPKSLRRFVIRETWHGMGAFGSFKLNWKDKPLLGTIVFALLTFAQAIGLVAVLAGRGGQILTYASLGTGTLLVATVWYRVHAIQSRKYAPALFVLYYFYYLARSYSILKLLVDIDSHRGER